MPVVSVSIPSILSHFHNTYPAIELLRLMLSPGTKGLFFFLSTHRPTENLKSSPLPWWTCCWSPSWTGHLCSAVLFRWSSTSYSKCIRIGQPSIFSLLSTIQHSTSALSEILLCRYVTFLSLQSLKYQSIKSYLSAIRHL